MDLKTVKELVNLRSTGRLFHSVGALTAKALSPLVTRFDLGRSSSAISDDLRHLTGSWGSNKSDKYCGARPLRALKVSNKTLKSILKVTGSQCSAARVGVMCSDRLVPVMSLAAAFCTNCRRWIYPVAKHSHDDFS